MYLYGPAENDYKQDGVHFESSSKTGQKHVAFVLKRVRVSNPQRLTYTQIVPPGSTVDNFYRLSRLVLVPLFNFVCVCVLVCGFCSKMTVDE